MVTDESDGGIGLFQAVSIEVGLIVGGALFSLTGVAVGFAGPAVVLAFVLAFSIAILGLLPTAMLGAAFPTTGGNYRYPATLVSRPLAFLSAIGLGISMFTGGLPLYALTAGQYVGSVVPVSPTFVGFGLLTLFFAVDDAECPRGPGVAVGHQRRARLAPGEGVPYLGVGEAGVVRVHLLAREAEHRPDAARLQQRDDAVRRPHQCPLRRRVVESVTTPPTEGGRKALPRSRSAPGPCRATRVAAENYPAAYARSPRASGSRWWFASASGLSSASW